MAYVVQLQSWDGSTTTTLDFLGTTYELVDDGVDISIPKRTQIWSGDSPFAHGSSLVASSLQNRELKITFNIHATTKYNISVALQAIEKMLYLSNVISTDLNREELVQVKLQLDTANALYYKVLDGSLNWSTKLMSVEQTHQRDSSGNHVLYDVELSLIVEPFGSAYSFKGGAWAVEMFNPEDLVNGSYQPYLYNNPSRATLPNYVIIPQASVKGEYPATTGLTIQIADALSDNAGKFYVGIKKGNQNFRRVFEDDDANVVMNGTPTSNSAASGGTYTPILIDVTTRERYASWVMSKTEVENTKGPYRVIAKVFSGTHWSTDIKYQVQVRYFATGASDYTTLYVSEWVRPLNSTSELLDLGTINLPPWNDDNSLDYTSLDFDFVGQKDSGVVTNPTINLDYIYLMPQDGGYRMLNVLDPGLPSGDALIDSWSRIKEYTTILDFQGEQAGMAFGVMPRLNLDPTVESSLHFLWESVTNNAEITREIRIAFDHQPKVLITPTWA